MNNFQPSLAYLQNKEGEKFRYTFQDLCTRLFCREFNISGIPNTPINNPGCEIKPIEKDGKLWSLEVKSSPNNKSLLSKGKSNYNDSLYKKIDDSVEQGIDILVIYTFSPLEYKQQNDLISHNTKISLDFRNGTDINNFLPDPNYRDIAEQFFPEIKNEEEEKKMLHEIHDKLVTNKVTDEIELFKIIQNLIDKHKTNSALEFIKIAQNPESKIDKIELAILEAKSYRKSHKQNKVFDILEPVLKYGNLNDDQKQRINIILADIYYSFGNTTKSQEYLNLAMERGGNNPKIEIIQQLINSENSDYKIPKDWVVGEDGSRTKSLSYFVKALSFWRDNDHQKFKECITSSLENSKETFELNTLYLDIKHYLQRLITEQIGTKEELFEKYNFIENELRKSEIPIDGIELKIIRIQIILNQLDQPSVNEIEELITNCYKLLSQSYCDVSFLSSLGFLMSNFPIPDQYVKLTFEKIKESQVEINKEFVSQIIAGVWSKVEFAEISNFLSNQGYNELIEILEKLNNENYSEFILAYLSQFSANDLKLFIRFQKDLDLSVELLKHLPEELQNEQEFISLNLLQRYDTGNIDCWAEATEFLYKIRLDNCRLPLLIAIRNLAYTSKKYDIEFQAIKQIQTQLDDVEWLFFEGLNYYHQENYSRAYQILSSIVSKLATSKIRNKEYILGSYLEILIQTNNIDDHLNSTDDIYTIIGDISKLDKERKFEILIKFAQYKKESEALKEEIVCILKQAYKLFDTQELGSFDTRLFTYSMSALLGLDEKEEEREIRIGDYIQLSDKSWFNLNSELVLDSIKITQEDGRFNTFLGKNKGDEIELESQKYNDQKLTILRYGKFENYLMMRAFEEVYRLSKEDPTKYGYVIQSDDIVTKTKQLMSDLTGVNQEIISQFENNEIPFYVLASYTGGVGTAMEQARYSNGYIKSNLGTVEDINKQYETAKKAHKNSLPIYIDYLSAITLLDSGLLDSLLKNFSNLHFPTSLVKFLRDKASSLKSGKLHAFIGINIKSGGLNMNEVNHEKALEISKSFYDLANKIENEANIYNKQSEEQKPKHPITQVITSDIVDACVLAQNNPNSVVFTEEPTYLYHNHQNTGNRLPEYFSTWVLSKYLYDNKYIDLDTYLNCFYLLTRDRHYHLPPTTKELYFTIFGDSEAIKDFRTDRLYKLNLGYILNEKYTQLDYSISQIALISGLILIANYLTEKQKYDALSKIISPLLFGNSNKQEIARKLIYQVYLNLTDKLEESQQSELLPIKFKINIESRGFNLLYLVIGDFFKGSIVFT